MAVAAPAYAAKDDRWHRHSAFGWAVTGYGRYELAGGKEARATGALFGVRLVCTPIREDRAAFDFAAGLDAGRLRGDGTYTVGTAYADARMFLWLWRPFYLQGGAGFTWLAIAEAGGEPAFLPRNVGISYFVGPALQLSPAFALVPEWRWDELPYGYPPYLRGRHRSWRILINLN